MGARLKLWAIQRYGSIRALAVAMGMEHPEAIYQYVGGQSLPGNRQQERLRALGCDLNWLLGYSDVPVKSADPEHFIVLLADPLWTEEQRAAMRKLCEQITKMPPGNVELAHEILRPLLRHPEKKGKGAK